MHIIILGNRDPADESTWSGIPVNLANGLRRCGHTVTVIGPLQPQMTILARLKLEFYQHFLGMTYMPARDPSVVRARTSMAMMLLENYKSADAVVVFHSTDAAFINPKIPLILIHDATWWQLLDFYPRYDRHYLAVETIRGGNALEELAFKNCDGIIFSTNWARNSALLDYDIDPAKVSVCPFGANFSDIPNRQLLGEVIARRGTGLCRILFCGSDWQRKGGDTALVVTETLRQRGVQAELHIVGCTPPAPVPRYVLCHGYISKKFPSDAAQLIRLYLESDFLLLPTHADCSPIVLAEAAAMALPVITCAVGGINEIVRDGLWGIALPVDSAPSDFADWILSAYTRREAYVRMAWAARLDYETRLNWDLFGTALADVIKQMLASENVTSTQSFGRVTG